jgi:hypothetical protein
MHPSHPRLSWISFDNDTVVSSSGGVVDRDIARDEGAARQGARARHHQDGAAAGETGGLLILGRNTAT